MRTFRAALHLLLLLTVITGIVYPLLVTGLAQGLFPQQANGSLIYRNEKPVASALLAQNITDPRYFRPRPSAGNYDGLASGGSNYGQSSPDLMQQWQTRLTPWQPSVDKQIPVPAELLQASASGLDPQISLAAAHYQLKRVAQARGWPESRVTTLLEQQTESASWLGAGVPTVNVMTLNDLLDQQDTKHATP